MSQLPANLPDGTEARLPATYEAARTQLAECERIDECKSWADKAEALKSYAKQANDDALRLMAERIQLRAVRRCGELLKAIEAGVGGRPSKTHTGTGTSFTRSDAARDAGLSKRQKDTALRVANVPDDEFEQAVESDEPPTKSELAEQGTQKRVIDHLQGRNPEEFRMAMYVGGDLRRMAETAAKTDAGAFARGLDAHRIDETLQHIKEIEVWLRRLRLALENEHVQFE